MFWREHENCSQMVLVGDECRTHFVRERVAIVDTGDGGKRARQVVEQTFGDVWRCADLRVDGGEGSAKVVQRPAGDTGATIKFRLGLAPRIITPEGCGSNEVECERREWYGVL